MNRTAQLVVLTKTLSQHDQLLFIDLMNQKTTSPVISAEQPVNTITMSIGLFSKIQVCLIMEHLPQQEEILQW